MLPPEMFALFFIHPLFRRPATSAELQAVARDLPRAPTRADKARDARSLTYDLL